jgi:hypothetical protein
MKIIAICSDAQDPWEGRKNTAQGIALSPDQLSAQPRQKE